MTPWVILGWVLIMGAVLVAVGLLVWLIAAMPGKRGAHSIGCERAHDFPAARYRPMARLFAMEDVRFLESQPGFRPEIGVRYRKARRRAVREYIGQMKRDFRWLHGEARRMLASGETTGAEADLVWTLIRQRAQFEWMVYKLEVHVMFSGLGMEVPNLEPLLEVLETMRLEMSRLSVAQAA
jgi:hypothetical protein